jgi:hypothetical protein
MHGNFSSRARLVSQEHRLTPLKNIFQDETPAQQSAHREIARRYASKLKRRSNLAVFRIRDLQVFYSDRYGETMPDDDHRALDHLVVLLHHVASLGDARALRACAARWCPWITDGEYAAIVAEVDGKPLRWRADALARRIALDDATRTRLGIKTIGGYDVSKKQRRERRKKANNDAKRLRRKLEGAASHSSSAEQTKPWLAFGISRSTYYRRLADGSLRLIRVQQLKSMCCRQISASPKMCHG